MNIPIPIPMTASSNASIPMGRRRRLTLEPRGVVGEGTVGRVVLCSESMPMPLRSRARRSSGSVTSASVQVSSSASASTVMRRRIWAVKFAEREKLQNKQSSLTVERKILQRVRHRNVVKMEWFADSGDTSVIGLEFCGAGDLFGLLYERLGSTLSEAEIRPLAAQIYDGIRALHRHNVVHRDLKLENLGLTLKGEVKILDFDSAFVFESEDQTVVTQCGTLAYASPEVLCRSQARFEPDFWSFGIILYELLCGCTPFEADVDSEEYDSECVRRICTVRHQYPRSIAPSSLTTAIDSLLEKQHLLRMNALALEAHPWFADILTAEARVPGLGDGVDEAEALAALVVSSEDETELELPAPFRNSFEATFLV